jgi:caulimovirus viroplasmin
MSYDKRFYAVFAGRQPGVYDDFNDAMEQVDGFEGAVFKSYDSPQEAAEAFRRFESRSDSRLIGALLMNATEHQAAPRKPDRIETKTDYFAFPEIDLNGWAVDASCMGNPGVMEYRGVELMTGRELFRVGPFKKGTNNIGEFLAIVHALALMAQRGEKHTVYSDSVSGMAWVRNRKVKTQLKRDAATEPVFRMMERALVWLNTHRYDVPIRKWDTDRWGEVPADFDRK